MEAKVIAGQDHLAQTISWTKGREKANGSNGEDVDKEDSKERVDKAKLKHRYGQSADSERRDDHVGRKPLLTTRQCSKPFLPSPPERLTMVPTLCRFSSVLSSSGTRSMPLASMLYRAAKRWILWYVESPVTKLTPGTALVSSAKTGSRFSSEITGE